MKRKIILLCVLCLFGTTGCNNKDEKPKNDDKKNCSLLNVYEIGIDDNFSCKEMNNISANGDGFFITKLGELYEFSLHNKYSTTNTNCKKIETDVKFNEIIRNTLISSDGNLYSYNEELKLIDNELEKKGQGYYGVDQMYIPLYRTYNNMFLLINYGTEQSYSIIEDNNVYLLKYSDLSKELIYTFPNGETIEKVTNGVIMTNKGYYKYDIVNKQKCEKYADVKCEYGIVKVDTKTNCNNIIYASDNLVVTKSMVE